MIRSAALALALVVSAPLHADVPRAVADIPAIQALVSTVTGDPSNPAVLLADGGATTGYALRPDAARVLDRSDLVIAVGAGLMPELDAALSARPADPWRLVLADVPGTMRLARVDGDRGGGDASPGRAGTIDPHLWLSPENARLWIATIATTLGALDPANATLYADRADAARAEIAEARSVARTLIADHPDLRIVAARDVWSYAEEDLGLPVVGVLSDGDGAPLVDADLRVQAERIGERPVDCLLAAAPDPSRSIPGLDGVPVVAVDPLGDPDNPGIERYTAILAAIADAVAACAAD